MEPDEDCLIESDLQLIAINTNTSFTYGKFKVTVELPVFLIIFALSISSGPISNIILYRSCVHHMNHTHEECHGFLLPVRTDATKPYEAEAQKYATFITLVKIILESLAPAVLTMFLGVWSDTYGRKPLIVWPLLGMAFTSMLIVVFSMMENLPPWWYILTVIPFSLTGGYVVLFTGAYCYVSDITPTEKSSFRMTLVDATVSAAIVLGAVISPLMIRHMGNVYLLLVAAALYVAAYVYSNVFIEESHSRAVEGGFSKILDWLHVREMVQECIKERPNHRRTQIFLLTAARGLSVFLMYGADVIDYLYTRNKLHWAIQEYTNYSAVSTTITFFGSFLGVGYLQRMLPISDLMFAVIGFFSAMARYVIEAFAVSSWQMYLCASVSLFSGLSGPLIRSFLTKTLPAQDIAKVFALMSAIEGIIPLLAPTVCLSMYAAMLTTFPGAVHLMAGCICLVCIILVTIVQYYALKTPASPYRLLNEEESLRSP